MDASKKKMEIRIIKGHIGIVEKVQETRLDTGMPLLCYMSSECILESRDAPTTGNNLYPSHVCIGYVQSQFS